jgi:hypothetical protein
LLKREWGFLFHFIDLWAQLRKELIPVLMTEEIELAVRNLIQAGFSILEDEVVKQVARIFGFDRTGAHIYDRVKGILKQMISRGDLVLKGDRLSLP